MRDLVATVLVALEELMNGIAGMYGRATVKHDADCEMGDICNRCCCPTSDRCDCTCGKLQGFHG